MWPSDWLMNVTRGLGIPQFSTALSLSHSLRKFQFPWGSHCQLKSRRAGAILPYHPIQPPHTSFRGKLARANCFVCSLPFKLINTTPQTFSLGSSVEAILKPPSCILQHQDIQRMRVKILTNDPRDGSCPQARQEGAL